MHLLVLLPLFSLNPVILRLSLEDNLASHPSWNNGVSKPDPLQDIDVIADLEPAAPLVLPLAPLRIL